MTSVIPIKPAGKLKITPENKCSFCRGSTCCAYFTQHIDTPRSMEEFDTLLWQLSHHNTQAYRDTDGWYLLFNTTCMHLQPGGRCGIYETRPMICRKHSNDDCEFDGPAGADDFKLYFSDRQALDAYCRKKFKNWDKRFKLAASKKAANKKQRFSRGAVPSFVS
jgi:Fe-S-cluster containining protein